MRALSQMTSAKLRNSFARTIIAAPASEPSPRTQIHARVDARASRRVRTSAYRRLERSFLSLEGERGRKGAISHEGDLPTIAIAIAARMPNTPSCDSTRERTRRRVSSVSHEAANGY